MLFEQFNLPRIQTVVRGDDLDFSRLHARRYDRPGALQASRDNRVRSHAQRFRLDRLTGLLFLQLLVKSLLIRLGASQLVRLAVTNSPKLRGPSMLPSQRRVCENAEPVPHGERPINRIGMQRSLIVSGILRRGSDIRGRALTIF